MLSLITVPVLVKAIATLNYTETSGCPGDELVVTCQALNTSILRWCFVNIEPMLTFINNNRTELSLPINESGIRTVIVAKVTSRICHLNDSCSMESLIVIPLRPDRMNFTLLCHSDKSDSETINITTKSGEYNAYYVHVRIRCTIFS